MCSRREFCTYPLSVNQTVVNGANVSFAMYIDRLGKLPLKNFEFGNTGAGTGVCTEGRTRTSGLCSAVLLVRGTEQHMGPLRASLLIYLLTAIGLRQAAVVQYTFTYKQDGFGGLVVSMLSSGTQVCGFKPGRSRWIFRA